MHNTTFNAKRPHGVVSGHPEIRYEQDGNLYRHDGSLYSPGEPLRAPEPPAEVKPDPVADANNKRAAAMQRIWAERRAAKEREAQEEIE